MVRKPSTFDAIVLNHPDGSPSADMLAAVLKDLKPKGKLLVLNDANAEQVKTALLFAGFVNVTQSNVSGKYFVYPEIVCYH